MKPAAKLGYLIGPALALVALVFLLLPGQARWHARGPANTGHETLACQECHVPAAGAMRQQVQANLRYSLGLRATAVDFQHQPVTNATCQTCHGRPKDNHPAHRFNEPRFAEARTRIQPQRCVSCHREHRGGRVTMEPTFCQHCHQKLALKNDPLEVSHETLIAEQKWSSCMTCHDFHGNHVMTVATAVKDALPFEQITAYFHGAPSPYSDRKRYATKEPRHD